MSHTPSSGAPRRLAFERHVRRLREVRVDALDLGVAEDVLEAPHCPLAHGVAEHLALAEDGQLLAGLNAVPNVEHEEDLLPLDAGHQSVDRRKGVGNLLDQQAEGRADLVRDPRSRRPGGATRRVSATTTAASLLPLPLGEAGVRVALRLSTSVLLRAPSPAPPQRERDQSPSRAHPALSPDGRGTIALRLTPRPLPERGTNRAPRTLEDHRRLVMPKRRGARHRARRWSTEALTASRIGA